jgi:GMP synthase-like glutamine amidotransferase
MDVLVLQHIACEPPAVYEDVMSDRGWRITRVELDEGEELPAWDAFHAIVAMGGPMGVYDRERLPWLEAEIAAIGAAVRAGLPFFGACLGVQLLASALGARVYRGHEPEVGVLPVRLTGEGRADPVVGFLPDEVMTLQWHQDTFDLPAGAVRLMGSELYPNQAFRFGARAYGVQFHLEVDERLAQEWARVPAYQASADRVLGAGGLDQLLAAFRERAHEMQRQGRELFTRFAEVAEDAGRT